MNVQVDRREAAPASLALLQSAILIALGLTVELLTLAWSHPTAFLVFAMVGGALVAAGVLRYLWVIVKG